MRRTTPASSSATPPGRRSRMCISMMSRSTARSLSRLIGGSAPKSATPPNFNRPKQIAMVVRQLASAIGRQKLRAEVFRQRHPVPPTCTHAASWSRRSAANALTHVPLIEPSFASDRKLAHMAGCCGSRDGEQPPTSAHQRQTTPHGGETSPSCRNCCAERLTARRTPCAALAVAADGLRFANPFMGYACCYQVRRGGSSASTDMALDHYVSQVHLKNFYSPALSGMMYAIRKSDHPLNRTNSQSVIFSGE